MKNFKQDAASIREHIHSRMSHPVPYSAKDYAHLGGAAALIEHLEKHGDPVKFVRNELKDVLDYAYKFERTKNPIYLKHAKLEIEEVREFVDRINDSSERNAAMEFVHEVHVMIHGLDNALRAPANPTHVSGGYTP
jgi:hypothetical protein